MPEFVSKIFTGETFISALVSALISLAVSFSIRRSGEKQDLDGQLDRIIMTSAQYPYLEYREFTNSWSRKNSDKKSLRYEQYATLVFNYLERLFKFYKCDKERIEQELAVKTWVLIHKNYWKHPTKKNDNKDSYDLEFQKLIDGYIKEEKNERNKKEKCK